MKIYLAGSIPKGDEESKDFIDWRKQYITVLEKVFDAEFITPLAGEVDETDQLLVVGKDAKSIKSSDLIIVNAEDRLGAGTAMELVIAKYLHKLVVTVLPKDTYHRRSNLTFGTVSVDDWIHPFVHTFSDFIVEHIKDVEQLKLSIFSSSAKDITIIDRAINHRESKLG